MSGVTNNRPTPEGGIVATNIRAEAIAVGPHATAIVNARSSRDDAQLLQAVLDLRYYIQSLHIDPQRHALLEGDLRRLERLAQKDAPDPEKVQGVLERFAEKLKKAGVVVKETAELIEPIKTITAVVGVALATLGL